MTGAAEQYRSVVYSSLESCENRENKRTDDDYYTQYTDVILGIIEIKTKGLGIDVCNIEKYSEQAKEMLKNTGYFTL